MELLVTQILKKLFFPPGLFLFALLVGLLLLKRRRRLAVTVLWGTLLLGYLMSTPMVAYHLVQTLEHYPPLSARQLESSEAQAIVVLSGGRYTAAPEYHADTVADGTLVRVRYAAYLHHRTGLPVLVSGGLGAAEKASLAEVMATALRQEFNVNEVWLEDQSRTTGENALFSKQVLTEKGVEKIYLVTHAWHMPRAVDIFQRAGLEVVAAPTRFQIREEAGIIAWLPSVAAVKLSNIVIHEYVGRLWYRVRY